MEPGPERNADVARTVMQWMPLGAHLWQDRETGMVYYTGLDPTRAHIPHTVWQPSQTPLQALAVEQHVAKTRGLREAYIAALIQELDLDTETIEAAMATGYPSADHASVIIRAILGATPAQRC